MRFCNKQLRHTKSLQKSKHSTMADTLLALATDPATVPTAPLLTYETYDGSSFNWFAWGGVALAMTFSNLGTAYGTAKSGMGIASLSVTRPHLAFKSIIPIIMAGILSIYGLIIAVLLSGNISTESQTAYSSFMQLSAGILSGFSNVAAGYAIGLVGERGVKYYAINENIFVALILILIFAEVLGLFGMITSIIVSV